MSIGSKVRSLRLQNNMTQKELCGDHMNRIILGRIESDKMLPSLDQLNYVAKRLNVDMSYFLSDIKDIDYNYTEQSLKKDDALSIMYYKGEYYKIVKNKEENSDKNYKDSYDESYYIGMSYFNLEVFHEAIKPLKKYINKYLISGSNIQQTHIINFLYALNTLFKIMLKNNNYVKCESYLKIAQKYMLIYNAESSYVGFSIYNNLAYLYLKQGKFNQVILQLKPFINNHKTLIYPVILASMYKALNIAYYNTNDYENSMVYIKKAIYLHLVNDNVLAAGECYFNYINALRYCSKFKEAIEILNNCLCNYSNHADLYQKFLLQEAIVYFNMGNYEKVIDIEKNININKLNQKNKYDYYFVMGHIEHVHNKNDNKAYKYLIRTIKHFKNNNYSCDLSVALNDLYEISGDGLYKKQAYESAYSKYNRKNILIL